MDDHPPGYRFYPTEEELIVFYLHNKLEGTRPDIEHVIPLVDIYELNPWHLPHVSGKLCHGDPEQWFFFTPRQQRETHGGRPRRTTSSGYWKATGSPGYVYSSSNRVIGLKKTMVFYKGKAPNGKKTKWKMNEYRATEVDSSTTSSSATPKLRHEFSLCRVYIKSGCLRAFDRRPSGGTTNETISHRNNVDGMATFHQNPPMVENTSSWDSSSSRDHARLSQAGEDSNWEMTEDDLHFLWEWESNWSQGIPKFLDP